MRNHRLLMAGAALMIAVAACGGSDTSDDTTAATTAATTAETSATTAAPVTTVAPATTAAPTTTAGGGDTAPSGDAVEINVTADATAFSLDEIVVKAGQEVTIIVKDKDTMSDEPHNFHVRAGAANYFTLIKAAPNTQQITFTIDTPGVYEFFCDTHLTEMAGVFIVEG